jgi:hypothetical protein
VGDYRLLAVFGYVDERLEDNTYWGFDFVLTRVKSSCDAHRPSERSAWDPGRLCVTRIFRTFEAGATEYTPLRGAGELTKEIYRLAFVFSHTAKGALQS